MIKGRDVVKLIDNEGLAAQINALAIVVKRVPFTNPPKIKVRWLDDRAMGQMDGNYFEHTFIKIA